MAKRLGKALMEKLDAKGLSLAVNYGSAQEVKHYHLHLLPQDSKYNTLIDVDKVFEILTAKGSANDEEEKED